MNYFKTPSSDFHSNNECGRYINKIRFGSIIKYVELLRVPDTFTFRIGLSRKIGSASIKTQSNMESVLRGLR
jgi:hypothetical protein